MTRSALLAATTLLLALAGSGEAQILPGYRGDYDAAKAQFRAYALDEFQDVFTEWLDAVRAGDAPRAARLYDDEAFVQLVEPLNGANQVEAALDRWIRGIDQIQSGLADFDASGSLAYASVRVILTGAEPSAGQGMMFFVLRRHGGDWRIRAQTLVMYDD